MQRILFIDRDGTLIVEPQDNFQIDKVEKFSFLPDAISTLKRIIQQKSFRLVMVSNQDGLGTSSLPSESFWPLQDLMIRILKSEGISFDEVLIDDSFESKPSPNRKPEIGLVKHYLNGEWDLANSYVIGDRLSDVKFAQNIGCKSILLTSNFDTNNHQLNPFPDYQVRNWSEIEGVLSERSVSVKRETGETRISLTLNIDGKGKTEISSGIGFLDHMLNLMAFHGSLDLNLEVKGDLHIDEHHSVEDLGILFGQALKTALGTKVGITRYGSCLLPMDESLAQVALDFSGRGYLVFKATFRRERVGELPVELVEHFMYSLANACGLTLHIKVKGSNDHHKIEAIFKALGRSIRMAVSKDSHIKVVPSTKLLL